MLAAEPTPLLRLGEGSGELGAAARTVANKFNWAGRPAPVATVVPLTADQQKRFAAGAELYKNLCLGCHQEDGRGKERLGANLVDSAYVTGADTTAMIRILLGGKEGPIGLMPPLGPTLSDEQIAAALTYIRRAWGHTGTAVDPLNVMEVRGLTKARTRPWTDAELQAGGGRGGRGGGQ
jgi:mono/diheme cytochrome c family protein